MANRRLLYVTAEDHYLYRAEGSALELEAKFSADDLGVSAFRDYLRPRRGTLCIDAVQDVAHRGSMPGVARMEALQACHDPIHFVHASASGRSSRTIR